MDAATRRDLLLITHTLEYLSDLEGQDSMLLVECAQTMLKDLLCQTILPLVNYVKHYCDVVDNEAQAELITANILATFVEA